MKYDGNDRGGLKRPKQYNEKRSYSGKCDIRLSASEDSMLNELASRNSVSRSEVMRKALKDFYKFNNEGATNGR